VLSENKFLNETKNHNPPCKLNGRCHSNKLEKLQLEAARIVIGLPIFTKTDSLYFETDWEPLHSRHHRRKLQLSYKIYNGLAPQYLYDLIPPTIQSTTIYPLRNGSDLIVPFCRLSSTNSSFIPSSVREWNKLEKSVRNLDTLLKFKCALLSNANEINIVFQNISCMVHGS
jgi:hypothetical protein